jgi:quercetin dioxygenase-like cupin family protein
MSQKSTRGLSVYVPGTPEEIDAVIAAPDNHEVVFENEIVRVLRVIVRSGEVEKTHTHKWPSVFIITQRPRIKYFNEAGEEVELGPPLEEGNPFWIEPEGVHWVENLVHIDLKAIRVELKE